MMYKFVLLSALVVMFTTVDCKKKSESGNLTEVVNSKVRQFQNPLLNQGGADPFIAQKEGYYYFLATRGNRISITKTRSMSKLSSATESVVWRPEPGKEYSSHIWAPELHFLEGKWYLYFAADNGSDDFHRMFVLENANADPTSGDWTFKGKISDSTDQWAIDGSVLTIGSKHYLIWSGWENIQTKYKQHIYLAAMANPWTLTGPRIKISSPTNDWERYEPAGIGSTGVNEGPIALQKDAQSPVFIIYSGSRYTSDNYCLAQIQLNKESEPTNPTNWTNKKQVFVKNEANNVYAPGHNGFFTSTGTDANGINKTETWLVYHARSTPNTPKGNRTARMQKINWNADGSPNFGDAVATGISMVAPVGEQ